MRIASNNAMEAREQVWRPNTPALLASLMIFQLAAQVAQTSLSAQEAITVSGEVTCPECAITLDTIVTLSGPDLQVTFTPGVAVDRRGRYLLTTLLLQEILVFDSTGTFLRTVGRRGEGPGEYQALTHINVGPKYIHVFDNSRGRTLLDHDFQVVRVDRFPANYLHSHVMEGEDVLFSGDVLTETSAGYGLHILGLSGEMSSFDGDGVWRSQTDAVYDVVTGDSASLWVVEPMPNRITRWDLLPEPTKAAVFERAVEEYDRHDPNPYLVPRARNVGALLDRDGLWVLWTAPDPRFTPRRIGGRSEEPPQEIRDTWLDLLDPTTGRTLARLHSDGSATGFVDGSRYFYFYHEDAAGEPSVIVVEPHLTRRPRRGR